MHVVRHHNEIAGKNTLAVEVQNGIPCNLGVGRILEKTGTVAKVEFIVEPFGNEAFVGPPVRFRNSGKLPFPLAALQINPALLQPKTAFVFQFSEYPLGHRISLPKRDEVGATVLSPVREEPVGIDPHLAVLIESPERN